MKRFYAFLAVMTGLLFIIIISASSSGAALIQQRGYTGAPSAGGGTESNCSQCHNSGNFGEPVVNMTISEMLGGPAVTEYTPGRTYFVSVNVSATGNPAAYGFQSLFLSDDGTAIRPQAGMLSNPSNGTQITTLGDRMYAEQQYQVESGDFSFEWEAPAVGTGAVTVYSVGNAVNFAQGSGGDNGSTAPTNLTLTEGAALPLSLLTFTGREAKGQIELTWETDNEIDFSHFSIEKQMATDWAEIGRVESRADDGTARYRFNDQFPEAGENTYRLRMNDLDGSYRFSDLLILYTTGAGLTIYPNPAVDFIKLTATSKEMTSVSVINTNGAIIYQGAMTGELDVHNYPSGIYYVETKSPDQRLVQRFIKR